jgi:hypothetical protein
MTKVGDCFHQEFQASMRANPCKYRGVNLGCTTWIQQHARLQAQARQQAKGHIITRLQPFND